MTAPISDGRRVFLKKLLEGTAASIGAVLVYRQPALAELVATAGADPSHDLGDHDYAFVVDVSKCIGCGNCVQACNLENKVPAGQFRTWIERYVVTDDGVHVDSPDGGMNGFKPLEADLKNKAHNAFFVPKLCNQCANPPCVQVCPVGATFTSPEGFVLIDPEHCIGCGYCIQACPYGARFMNAGKHIADKCTWCYHRVAKGQSPACVTVCPTQARLFGDLKDTNSQVAKVVREDRWRVLKPDMHTDPQCFYVGSHREIV